MNKQMTYSNRKDDLQYPDDSDSQGSEDGDSGETSILNTQGNV